ncbi:MAG TPA: ethylbenzene dehydrogenase-related protein [Vicinamibacterales bacterium]|nr:ethylbenzene dehydrogenase-related protein [Vicinamibacterales bacterium]
MTVPPATRAVVSTMLLAAAIVGCRGDRGREDIRPGPLEGSLVPTRTLPASPAPIDLGRQTYLKQCAPCHGANGDGEGPAAYLLYPRPRDFTTGQFRLVSTWDGVPTDEDLFRTISRGMPGSAMPPWNHLPEETRWGLVHYIKTFSKRPLTIQPPADPPSFGASGTGPIRVPPEPPYDANAQKRARELYVKGCAPCHGPQGRGDGQQQQVDSKGYPTRPRDLTLGVFKGSPDPEHVYRRIVAGLPGSPMPQSAYLHGDDGWHLTHLVRSLSSPEQRAKAEMKRFRIVAARVDEVPIHQNSWLWSLATPVTLHLMPLWWRTDRPEYVTVKALHDGNKLAVLLKWEDATHDATAIRPQDFRDAAAVQFALGPDPPFFAMGEAASAVNIWMWKSERQADLEAAFQDLEKVYPNIGIDSYPNLLRSPLEQPTRHALTLQSDPRFVTAWGAGNIVADPTRRTAAEDLTAQGFGTLRARPAADQAVEARGEWELGSYEVAFVRQLAPRGRNAVRLRPGDRVPVAFAVWNGSAGDANGKKSVTIWQELYLAR